ncbi:CD59 glycoprotein-like isoform 1-T2 [Discoglossus pictus]
MSGIRNCMILGVILLSLCNTGWTLKCYKCVGMPNNKCETEETCSSGLDACINLKTASTKTQQCIAYSRCTKEQVAIDFGVTSFSLECCQNNLCNFSIRNLPSALLPITLFAALLMIFY